MQIQSYSSTYWLKEWLKPHVYPLHSWYYYSGKFYADYPIVSMYIHYLAGFLYRYIDPISYSKQYPHEYEEHPVGSSIKEFEKWGIRLTILLTTFITYYPCVIWIVTKLIEKRKAAYRLILITLFLNAPFILYTDYLMVQFNCVHYSFFLFTIYFCLKKEFYKATIFASLTVLTKQITVLLCVPVGLYIIAENLKKLNKQKKNFTQIGRASCRERVSTPV